DGCLFAVKATLDDHAAAVDVAGADLHPEGHAALLPVELLVAGAVVAPVNDHALARLLVKEVALDLAGGQPLAAGLELILAAQAGDDFVDAFSHFGAIFGRLEDGDDRHHVGRDARGQD